MPDGQRIEFQVKISQLGPESDFSFCAAGGAFRIAARACEQLNAAGLGRNRRASGDYWRVLPVLAREEPRLFFSKASSVFVCCVPEEPYRTVYLVLALTRRPSVGLPGLGSSTCCSVVSPSESFFSRVVTRRPRCRLPSRVIPGPSTEYVHLQSRFVLRLLCRQIAEQTYDRHRIHLKGAPQRDDPVRSTCSLHCHAPRVFRPA